MSLPVIFLPLAEKDILDAEDHFATISEHLSDRFINELDRTVQIIVQHSGGFQKIVGEFRQAPLDVFPFVIVYQIIKDAIVIFRLFHTRQDPQLKFIGE